MFHKRTDKAKVKDSQLDESNRVTVFVWIPQLDGENSTGKEILKERHKAEKKKTDMPNANIGHVAMCTPNRYISLWPKESTRGRFFKVLDAAYQEALSDDLRNEEREPDTIVTLYSLNISNIDRAFDIVQASGDGFVLAGNRGAVSSKIEDDDREARNCNGLVYELLKKGGVDKITPFGTTSSKFIGWISPDKFDEYIKTVKRAELRKYPETAGFSRIEGEYSPIASATAAQVEAASETAATAAAAASPARRPGS